jgi:O-antigen/teichoic acid export membrane protein
VTAAQTDPATSDQAIRGMFGRDSLYMVVWTGQTLMATVITPVATRLLGPHQFGQVSAAVAVMQVLVAVGSLSLQTAVQRAFAEENGDAKARRIVAVSILVGVITLVLAYATGPLWSPPAGLGHFPLAVKYAVAWSVATAVSNAALGLLRSRDQFGYFVVAGLMQSVVAAGLAISLVIGRGHVAANFILGELIGQVLCVAVALAGARPILPSRRDIPMLTAALRYSTALVPALVAGFVIDGSDRLLIHGDIGPVAVARFSAARNIGGFVVMFLLVLEIVWMPKLYSMRDNPAVEQVLRASRNGLLVMVMYLTFALTLASPLVLWLWVPPSYRPDHLVLITALIAATGVSLAAGQSFIQVLLLSNRSGRVSIAVMGSAGVNLGLNLFVVPRFGITGAAIVTLISFTLQAATLGYFAALTGRLPSLEGWLVACALGTIALAVASSAIPVSPAAIVLRVLLAALASGMFAIQLITFIAPEKLGRLTALSRHLPLLTVGLAAPPDTQTQI